MSQNPHQNLTDPKLAACAIAAGGKLERTETAGNGRLAFIVSGLPADFATKLVNDEVIVSGKAFIAAMEHLLRLIRAHRGDRA